MYLAQRLHGCNLRKYFHFVKFAKYTPLENNPLYTVLQSLKLIHRSLCYISLLLQSIYSYPHAPTITSGGKASIFYERKAGCVSSNKLSHVCAVNAGNKLLKTLLATCCQQKVAVCMKGFSHSVCTLSLHAQVMC